MRFFYQFCGELVQHIKKKNIVQYITLQNLFWFYFSIQWFAQVGLITSKSLPKTNCLLLSKTVDEESSFRQLSQVIKLTFFWEFKTICFFPIRFTRNESCKRPISTRDKRTNLSIEKLREKQIWVWGRTKRKLRWKLINFLEIKNNAQSFHNKICQVRE